MLHLRTCRFMFIIIRYIMLNINKYLSVYPFTNEEKCSTMLGTYHEEVGLDEMH